MHEQFAMNIRTVAAVDNEPTAMKYWCRNHKAIFLHELMDVTRLLDTAQPFGVLADVAPRTVAYILAHTSVNLITASPPCQAWTHGGKRKGLLDDNGLQLLNLLAVLRVSQTPWVALENVDGLRTHAHWPMMAQAIIFAGYRFVWEGISDLAQVLPMTRKRYLALLVRDDLPYSQLRMEHKLPTWPGTLFSRWTWPIALPEDHISSLVLNPEELAIYADPAFGRGHNAQQVLQNRTVNGHQILASAMARYSAQHEVKTRGIYAQLVPHGEPFECHPNQLRFLSAAEYLMAMGVTHDLQVPADNRAAHALTGDSILVLHAIQLYHVLCNFQRYFSGAGTQPFEIVVQKFLAVRLHARNSEIIMTEGLLVIRPDQVAMPDNSDALPPQMPQEECDVITPTATIATQQDNTHRSPDIEVWFRHPIRGGFDTARADPHQRVVDFAIQSQLFYHLGIRVFANGQEVNWDASVGNFRDEVLEFRVFPLPGGGRKQGYDGTESDTGASTAAGSSSTDKGARPRKFKDFSSHDFEPNLQYFQFQGKAIPVTRQVNAGHQGIVYTDYPQVAEWIHASGPISAQPLAVLLLGIMLMLSLNDCNPTPLLSPLQIVMEANASSRAPSFRSEPVWCRSTLTNRPFSTLGSCKALSLFGAKISIPVNGSALHSNL